MRIIKQEKDNYKIEAILEPERLVDELYNKTVDLWRKLMIYFKSAARAK